MVTQPSTLMVQTTIFSCPRHTTQVQGHQMRFRTLAKEVVVQMRSDGKSGQWRPWKILAMAFLITLVIEFSFAADPGDTCSVPAELQHEIVSIYPGARIVSFSDLDSDDKKFFEADHGNACPGRVDVDFYGDGKPTLALVLITRGKNKVQTELAVANLIDKKWELRHLDTGGPSQYAPVVWSEPAGTYRDIHGRKTIRASRPVIIFSKYEAWSILYAWTDKGLSKIWIAD